MPPRERPPPPAGAGPPQDSPDAPGPPVVREQGRTPSQRRRASGSASVRATPVSGTDVTTRCRGSCAGFESDCGLRFFVDGLSADPLSAVRAPSLSSTASRSLVDVCAPPELSIFIPPVEGPSSAEADSPGSPAEPDGGPAEGSSAETAAGEVAESPGAGEPEDCDDESDDAAPNPASSGAPHATPGVPDMTVPIPNATANAPTRPTQLAYFIAVLPVRSPTIRTCISVSTRREARTTARDRSINRSLLPFGQEPRAAASSWRDRICSLL